MRNSFSSSLSSLAKRDKRVLLLTGDHGYALFDEFRKSCLDQYINAGVAEQNMLGVAAGLAKAGFKPFCYGLSSFVPVRVLEQIKIDICYENLPVVIVGDGAGVVYSYLGASHQSLEDFAIMRALPNITIFSPADNYEMDEVMRLAAKSDGPVYIRMGKADLGQIHSSEISLNELMPLCVRDDGKKMAFLATGSMVSVALKLLEIWPESSVWSFPILKPINQSSLSHIFKNYSKIISLEEHSLFGGFGSALSEFASTYYPKKICKIGTQDRFSQYCGSYDYLLKEHGIDLKSIRETIESFHFEN